MRGEVGSWRMQQLFQGNRSTWTQASMTADRLGAATVAIPAAFVAPELLLASRQFATVVTIPALLLAEDLGAPVQRLPDFLLGSALRAGAPGPLTVGSTVLQRLGITPCRNTGCK
jgi:hypothetical protein